MPRSAHTLPPPSRRRSWRLVGAVAATVLALALFLLPRSVLPDPGRSLGGLLPDWLPAGPVVHVLICAGAAFVWVWALRGVRPLRLLLVGIPLALGTEALQLLPFVERSPRWGDALANVLGVLLGGLFALALTRWRGRRAPGRA